jgi:pimeloyl-ACP methyl ester carboxylesterase
MPVLANLYYSAFKGSSSSAPPVILIHGAGSQHLIWPLEIRRMSKSNVYAIDLPGHGNSSGLARQKVQAYQNVILDFIYELKREWAVLVGHSLGAAIALQMAADHPAHVAGLVCISAAATFRPNRELTESIRLPQYHKSATVALKNFFKPVSGKDHWYPALEKSIEKLRPALWYSDLRAGENFDIRPRLNEIKAPALVMSGTADPLVPYRDALYLAKQLPAGCFIGFEGNGHMLILEEPARVAAEIKAFLASIHPRPDN